MNNLLLFYKTVLMMGCFGKILGGKDWSRDRSPEKWNKEAKLTLDNLLNRGINKNIAKNVIVFLGDGMGISTVTAGRIRKGQLKGENGEETVTNMENFPHLGLAKTYNIDAQTADSAGTGTAYLCGVKTSAGILGLNGHAIPHDCPSAHGNEVDSILKWAHKANKSVGIVTTTRITHATPGASYAHSAFRDWEAYDGIRFTRKQYAEGCKDIAAQLIEDNSFINVVLGGGRLMFLPNTTFDYTHDNVRGHRIDNKHLINDWLAKMGKTKKKYKFIYNASEFRRTDFKDYDHILGLLSHDNLRYECDRNGELEPSIAEMTLKAIEILSQNKNGYFLLVEGGRIDHGHHENKAHKALDDFVAFDDAIGEALKVVNERETLIVVTADHSHTFTIGGNSVRGNPVYGLAISTKSNVSDTNLTFTSILYGNGPGGLRRVRHFNLTIEQTGKNDSGLVSKAYNHISKANIPIYLGQSNYTQEAVVYKRSATHAAEDVAIYANGPMSFLFTKTIEQSYITHFMAYSACIGPYSNNVCRNKRGAIFENGVNMASVSQSGSSSIKYLFYTISLYIHFLFLFAFFNKS